MRRVLVCVHGHRVTRVAGDLDNDLYENVKRPRLSGTRDERACQSKARRRRPVRTPSGGGHCDVARRYDRLHQPRCEDGRKRANRSFADRRRFRFDRKEEANRRSCIKLLAGERERESHGCDIFCVKSILALLYLMANSLCWLAINVR